MQDVVENPPGVLEHQKGMLNIEHTLANGQMFRWRQAGDGWWDAIRSDRLVKIRKVSGDQEVEDRFEFYTFPGAPDADFVRSFFRLDIDLEPIYRAWNEADPYLGSLSERFQGLRLIGQEPEECLLSFICSTANFIPRIMKAVAFLSKEWGEPITGPSGETLSHAFPRAPILAELDPEVVHAKTGLEWRAANLIKVARQVAARPHDWLQEVATLDYARARAELMELDGVGPKIADCVCLFAMKKDQAVPVDTHVWQLTRERYLPDLRSKTLTSAGYAQVLKFFQSRFDKAGWAQQYLFYDHLLASREKRRPA